MILATQVELITEAKRMGECPSSAGVSIMSEQAGEKFAVLVIDDEPIVGDALMLVLSDNGYEVAVARTGRDGLDKIRHRRFDVTITDLGLPDMEGLDVLVSIREKDPHSLVIVITAYNTPEVVDASRRLGAVEVLAKPFSPSDVLCLLSRTLEKQNQVQ
jgi:DNA-binding NtrC family response regulator